MLKRIITLSFFVSLVACKAVPVSSYPGSTEEWIIPEGTVVDNTIYTFGGLEKLKLEPYIVNPDDDDDEDDFQMRMFDPFDRKPTDLAYAYDISRDQWRVETKSPVAWKSTNSVAVNKDIYVFSGMVKNSYYGSNELWKYDTERKNWSQRTSLPFLWSGSLLSCSINKKIYFTSEGGTDARNIIHVYNVDSDEWQQPIFINKKISIRQMLCLDESIKIFGFELTTNSITGEIVYGRGVDSTSNNNGVFTVHYNGTTIFSDTLEEKKIENLIMSLDEYFYFYVTDFEVENALITRVNTRTSEYEMVASDLPYNFTNPLFVPIDSNQIFLFAGMPKMNYNKPVSEDAVKEWSHKIVTGDQ